MSIPTIVFGVLLALACGAFYHLIRGGPSKRLALDLVLGLAGFWLGDTLAWMAHLSFMQVGVLNAGAGVILSLVVLAAGELVGRFFQSDETAESSDQTR